MLALIAVASTLALAGCDTSGTVEVLSADELTVDLVFTEVDAASCTAIDNSTVHISAVPITTNGASSCHVQGSVQTSALDGVTYAALGDYGVFSADFRGEASLSGNLDVTLVLPGTVTASTVGSVSRNSVHFTGTLESLAKDHVTVVSVTRQTPPAALLGVLGLLVGVGATLLVLFARRRSASAPPEFPGAGPEGQPDAEGEPDTGSGYVDGAPATAAPTVLESPHPDLSDPPTEGKEPDAPPDHTIWARPDDR